MSRNFGIGNRDMRRAGAMVLEQARQNRVISFATKAKYESCWHTFVTWAKGQSINRMEAISPKDVIAYGKELASRVDDGDMSASSAQDAVSAVNRVMHLAHHSARNTWNSVSPTKDCQISERVRFREVAPECLARDVYESRLEQVRQSLSDRSVAVCELAREFGLRTKEASLLNATSALKQASREGSFRLSDGTKGGRDRNIPVPEQKLAVLQRACDAQKDARAIMPAETNWKAWRDGELAKARQIMGGLHELRSAYACERYTDLIGHPPPCAGGSIHDRELEALVRLAIAEELGHGRLDVVAEYVGSRK